MVAEVPFHPSPGTVDDESEISAAVGRKTAEHDAELVRRFNGGQESTFDEIIARYRPRLVMFSLTILRNRADAEEVAQDTLIRAHRHLGDFRGHCSLSSWLHTIALNLSRNRYAYYYRRRHHVTQSLDCAISADNPATFIDVAASEEPNPVAEVTARELTSLVAVCIEKLTPPHREILERRVLESWSYEEIADTIGISIGTVKSRIARARKRLRELLACECPEFEPETEPFEWLDTGRIWRGPQQGC